MRNLHKGHAVGRGTHSHGCCSHRRRRRRCGRRPSCSYYNNININIIIIVCYHIYTGDL